MTIHHSRSDYMALRHLSTTAAALHLGRAYETVRMYRLRRPETAYVPKLAPPVKLPVPAPVQVMLPMVVPDEVYSNRCRPEYRHLTPKAECRLRSLRLRFNVEHPGALPSNLMYEDSMAIANDRRGQIIDAIAGGYNTQAKLHELLNKSSWVNSTLRALVTLKAVTPARKRGITTYAVRA